MPVPTGAQDEKLDNGGHMPEEAILVASSTKWSPRFFASQKLREAA